MKMTEINQMNQRLAVKLQETKSKYKALDLLTDFEKHKQFLGRLRNKQSSKSLLGGSLFSPRRVSLDAALENMHMGLNLHIQNAVLALPDIIGVRTGASV